MSEASRMTDERAIRMIEFSNASLDAEKWARDIVRQRDAALERERVLRGALQRAMPALWIMATSGNADAIAIHEKALAALAAKGEK